MANYYTTYAVYLPITKEQEPHVRRTLDTMQAPFWNNSPPPEEDAYWASRAAALALIMPTGTDTSGVYLSVEEGAVPPSGAAALMSELLKLTGTPFLTFRYADTCSVWRPDGFGGGTVIVTPDGYHVIDASSIEARAHHHHAAGTLPAYLSSLNALLETGE